MAIVRGCEFPDHLRYDVPRHTWYSETGDGFVRVGMTTVAIALAREVLVFTPKRVGRKFDKHASFATVESAKWIGSVRAGFAGTVLEVNEALVARPMVANTDCYGAGWMMVVEPSDESWREALVTGPDVARAYAAWMDAEAFPGCARG